MQPAMGRRFCAQTRIVYTMAIVRGALILLRVDRATYRYHAVRGIGFGSGQEQTWPPEAPGFCEPPMALLSDSGLICRSAFFFGCN